MAVSLKPITLTAAATLSRNVHGGTVVNLNNATGFTVTLPAATGKGDKYKLFMVASVTSGNMVIAAAGTDILQGAVAVTTDTTGVTVPTTGTSDKITMNGGTTGGIKGSWVELQDVASGIWGVGGFLVSTGAEGTPFSET